MSKFFNILLFTATFLLILQIFGPKPSILPTVNPGGLLLVASKSVVTVPNVPQVLVYSNNTGAVSLDLCRDLKFSVGGAILQDLPSAFCQSAFMTTNGTGVALPLNRLPLLFQTPGQVTIQLSRWLAESSVSVQIEPKGLFNSFFSYVVYAPIYNLFALIAHHVTGDVFLWALIIVTILIRLALLYPQHKVLVSSRRMQAIQPQVQDLQKQHAGDQVALGQAMLALYKKEGVNPLSSIMPLLFQLPILIVLYEIVADVKNPLNEYYLYGFLADFDPARLDTMAFGISLDTTGGVYALILALLVGGAQFAQIKLSYAGIPTAKKSDKKEIEIASDATKPAVPSLDPEVMRLMMLYVMPAIMTITTYFFPLGVGVYWFIGTIFMLVQQLVANSVTHIKNRGKKSQGVIESV